MRVVLETINAVSLAPKNTVLFVPLISKTKGKERGVKELHGVMFCSPRPHEEFISLSLPSGCEPTMNDYVMPLNMTCERLAARLESEEEAEPRSADELVCSLPGRRSFI